MIKLYTTHCPKCQVLEMKLKQKNIEYEECVDVQSMLAIGIKSAPVLEVDDVRFDFSAAVKWVNAQERR